MANSNVVTGIKWVAIGTVSVLAFIYLRGCGKKNAPGSTVTKIDTVYNDTGRIITKIDTAYIPKPHKVIEKLPGENIILPSSPFDSLYTEALKQAYFGVKYYRDTVFNDSAGVLILNDTITENRISGRGVTADLEKQIITRTVTITGVLPKRITAYWGISAGGNKSQLFKTAGATFGIMDRKGRYYGASANILINGKPFYGGQVMFPIHLKK